MISSPFLFGQLLRDSEDPTGLRHTWEVFESVLEPFSEIFRCYNSLSSLWRSGKRDPFSELESQDSSSMSTQREIAIPQSIKKRSTSQTIRPISSRESERCDSEKAETEKGDSKAGGQKPEITIVVDRSDNSAPNLLLNCHDRVSRSEIYLAAAFGAFLQLGAILYFGIISYYEPIQGRFLKNGKKAVGYAFPCAAAGTILLVSGLFICSWVVGESTTETYYEAKDHQMFIVWLQKDHTVSDQVFKPYAIYPTSKRERITMSRRNPKLDNQFTIRNRTTRHQATKVQAIKEGNTNDGSTGDQKTTGAQSLDWPLQFITFLGALISLVGFISQFIGMRGLNWTASIVQLGITVVVTILRVIVRRGLGKSPFQERLKPKYELEWFALSLGDLATAPWAILDGNSSGDKNPSRWSIRTGCNQRYLPLTEIGIDQDQPGKDSEAHKVMMTRQKLGKLAGWKSPVFEEAVRLSSAIEMIAQAFLGDLPDTKYLWTIPANYEIKKEHTQEYVHIELVNEAGKWKVDHEVIEAILSLWLYSTPSTKPFETNRRRSLRLYGPSQFLEHLSRDLKWWMPESVPEISAWTMTEIKAASFDDATAAAEANKKDSRCIAVGFTSENGDDVDEPATSEVNNEGQNDENQSNHQSESQSELNSENENKPEKRYLVVECQDEREKLFSRDLLFSFVRAIAKMPQVTMTSASSAYQMNYSKVAKGWKQMRLKNDKISNLARKLEMIGFGTLPDIYFDLIVPLSVEQKLTNVKDVIVEAAKQAQGYERSCEWKKLVDTCSCLLDLALQFDLTKEPSGPFAMAVCLGFLCKLHDEALLQKSEARGEEELTTQLEILRKKFEDERFKSLISFLDLPEDEWPSAPSFRLLIGSAPDYTKSFPESFQVTYEHMQIILESKLKQKLRTWKFNELEKTDAFGWSPLHYIANFQSHNIHIDPSQEGEIPNLRDVMGWTPLQHACFVGNEEVVDMLLDRDTPIEVAGNDGVTPIHCAVRSGKADILQKLIEKMELGHRKYTRKSMAHVDRNGRYPIHWAAVAGDISMIRLLKDDIGLTDRFGWTCLHLAAIYGHQNLLNYIIDDCVANVDLGDNDMRTPLHLAVKNESLETVKVLLLKGGANVNKTTRNGSTPLHLAAKQKDMTELLLKNGAHKNATDIEGRTPLFLALANGMMEVAALLIEVGADITLAAKDGRTPLHMALSHGKRGLETAKKLLQAGANAKAEAKDEATPLHIAAECGPLEAIGLLVEAEVDINATDEYGQTPLLIAIYKRNWEIAELLLNKGASVDADRRDGYTPLLGAIIGGGKNIVQRLLDAKANLDIVDEDGYSPLHLAALNGERGILQKLIKAGAEINAMDASNNQTPLHIAVREGDEQIVRILLKEGANTELLNSPGFSPLQYALYRGDLRIVKEFVEHDKESTTKVKAVLQKGKAGDTPLHTLCYWTYYESNEQTMCEMLDELLSVTKDIDINAKNDAGRTPLDLAVSTSEKYRRFINTLVENGAESGSEETRKTFETWKNTPPDDESSQDNESSRES